MIRLFLWWMERDHLKAGLRALVPSEYERRDVLRVAGRDNARLKFILEAIAYGHRVESAVWCIERGRDYRTYPLQAPWPREIQVVLP